MSFNEANTVRDGIRDYLVNTDKWDFVAGKDLPRDRSDVLIDRYLYDALVELNPEIKRSPERADEVIYKLKGIVLPVHMGGSGGSEGLVRSNEKFSKMISGDLSMPFGKDGNHVTIKVIDFEHPENNHYVVSTEVTYKAGVERRMDVVLYINGIPVVIGECKTPVRQSESWMDAAIDIEEYQKQVPALFVPGIFSFGTEGKELYYGTLRTPLDKWAPWIEEEESSKKPASILAVLSQIEEMLQPNVLLDLLENFTVYATDKKNRKIKIITRHQQYDAANKIVERVIDAKIKKGLIWHFQGSGKSLLMAFTAQKLRMEPRLKNPTVIVVVDRVDLDTQITATFNATDIPNVETAGERSELQKMLLQDARKIIITTIHKFGEADGVLNERDNIIVLVDEAHRTQEGNLGRQMRAALPNAFFFGFTGTPINKRDRNTFWTFGAEEDKNGYISRYSFEDSLRDKATLPLIFEPRMLQYHVDQAAIDEEFEELTKDLNDIDKEDISKRAARVRNFVHNGQRYMAIAQDIHQHFAKKVEPNGFKAMLICHDRYSCVQYSQALDVIMGHGASDIVMTLSKTGKKKDPDWWYKRWDRTKEEEEKLLDRYRDPNDPLKILIVTSKLLTGFDAPILQTIYLDKVLRDHTLLQAVCRTNRTYGRDKSYGLIVDYIGVFDEVAKALVFDEKDMKDVIKNIESLKRDLPVAMAKCLSYFPDIDRTLSGYEGLIPAQECLPNNDIRDKFAADYSVLTRLWEAISPDEILDNFENDYRWLTGIYWSVKPTSQTGKMYWHSLGAKTLDIINRNVKITTIQDDLETVIVDAETVQRLIDENDPKKVKVIEIKIIKRLQKHLKDPEFIKLGQKLEDIKREYEEKFIDSLEFLKRLLELASDVLQAEKKIEPKEEQQKAKAALTELFNEAKGNNTHIIVERIVNDIDEIVKSVRWEGWQNSHPGEREVKQALRSTLMKYKLHQDQDLFDRAYEYIKQYY